MLDRVLTLVSNLIPLVGVWRWGWDMFEVLILFWMQTVLAVAMTALHVRKLPHDGLGEIKVSGRMRPATHRDHVIQISIVGVVFCAGHLGFLWVFFSGDWHKLVTGPATFWHHFVIANGAWVALLLNAVAGIIHYAATPPRGALVASISRRTSNQPSGNIDDLFLALFIRIFAMQAAIIFGAMLAKSYGATHAPMIILILLKTLFDLGASFPARRK